MQLAMLQHAIAATYLAFGTCYCNISSRIRILSQKQVTSTIKRLRSFCEEGRTKSTTDSYTCYQRILFQGHNYMTSIFLQSGPKQTYFRKMTKIRSNIYQQFIIGLTMNNNVNDVQFHINVHEPKQGTSQSTSSQSFSF